MHVTRVRSATLSALVCLGCGVIVALPGCSDDSPSTAPTTASPTTSTVPAPSTTTTSTTTSTTTTTSSTTTSSSTTAPEARQPAIWPAPTVVFDTPDAAAADFVEAVLGVPAVLGPFEAGDARSGEMIVFSPGEGTTPVERSRLLLRRLGPDDGWFVIGAVHETTTVDSPEAGSTVVAGLVTVSGVGHGFEASVMVSAYVAGVATPLDAEHTMAGSMESPGPYEVTLDLSGATTGDMVMVLVRGGTGLETDPGEFAAIALVIGS